MESDIPKQWVIGPFKRPVDQPIIKPRKDIGFHCPIKNESIYWMENHTFNPASAVYNGKIHLLFRAEDGEGDIIASYTSRIGYAVSSDGLKFDVKPTPVLYPDNDVLQEYEWPGGVEDPRLIEMEDGTFVLYYTMYNRKEPVSIGAATSQGLNIWKKHGPIFKKSEINVGWHKAAGVVQEIKNGRLVAKKINGKYYMYWGEFVIYMATSEDLINWEPVMDGQGNLKTIIEPRSGYFDSDLTEVGPPPVLTDDGIVLIYNGKNDYNNGDSDIYPGAYTVGQVLFDKNDPARVLDRTDKPFLIPELDFEKNGQYREGTVFAEGLVLFNDQWYLYYGASDTYVGVATAPYKL